MPRCFHPNEAELLHGVELVSTDLFDTLLLRTLRSERARIVAGERSFARKLAEQGLTVSEIWLVEARLEAQRLAYRALNMAAQDGEVALTDVIRRQIAMLGLPADLCGTRLAIEIAVEKEALRPNRPLAALLRHCRSEGRRVIAISDIGLPTSALETLVPVDAQSLPEGRQRFLDADVRVVAEIRQPAGPIPRTARYLPPGALVGAEHADVHARLAQRPRARRSGQSRADHGCSERSDAHLTLPFDVPGHNCVAMDADPQTLTSKEDGP